jgi:hypothetical protein
MISFGSLLLLLSVDELDPDAAVSAPKVGEIRNEELLGRTNACTEDKGQLLLIPQRVIISKTHDSKVEDADLDTYDFRMITRQ